MLGGIVAYKTSKFSFYFLGEAKILKTCISPRLHLPYCLHGYARPPAIIQPTDIRLTTTANRNEHTQTQAGHQGRCNQEANDAHLFCNIEMWISEKVMNPAKHIIW